MNQSKKGAKRLKRCQHAVDAAVQERGTGVLKTLEFGCHDDLSLRAANAQHRKERIAMAVALWDAGVDYTAIELERFVTPYVIRYTSTGCKNCDYFWTEYRLDVQDEIK